MRVLLFLLTFLVSANTYAAHAYAQFGDVKYSADFTHFSYVNPAAPKGGEIRMVPPTRPTNFDKFNPFTLRGTAPYGISTLMVESQNIVAKPFPTLGFAGGKQQVLKGCNGWPEIAIAFHSGLFCCLTQPPNSVPMSLNPRLTNSYRLVSIKAKSNKMRV